MKQNPVYILPVLLLAGCAKHEEATPKPVVEVKLAKAAIEDVRIAVHAPATVFAREQANINSRITAPIRKLLVRKGDTVAAGQVLAELDSRDLAAQRDESAASVNEAEANLQRVTTGTLPTDIERARGQLAITEAALNQAQKFFDRRSQLFQQGAIPQRDLQVSQTDLAQAKTTYDVSKKTLDLLQNQSGDKDILMAKSKVDQARARASLLRTQLDFAQIRSSFAGTITEQFMFPGDMAKPDAPIFTVMDLSVAVVRAQVPDAEAGAVHSGELCTFSPADGGAAYDGRVTVVNQVVDPQRRTIETWCEIPNPKRALRSGTFGQVTIVTGSAPGSVVVPLTAVQFLEGTKKGVIMAVGEKSAAVKKEVETGEVFDGKVQIKSGLDAGVAVIVQGGYGLPEGTEIREQKEGEKKPEEKKQ